MIELDQVEVILDQGELDQAQVILGQGVTELDRVQIRSSHVEAKSSWIQVMKGVDGLSWKIKLSLSKGMSSWT